MRSKLISKLRQIVEVSDDPIDLQVYSQDSSQLEGKALGVIWPADAEEVVKVIKLANTEGFSIVPRGGGTSLVGGAIPQNSFVMDMSKMNRILEIKGKTAVVEAGVAIDQLNMELVPKGLYFPVIPASHKVCTVGGTISTNAAGIRAVRFGKMSDWIEELEVVTGKGELIKVKEDMDDFCGTEGLIGVIVKAKLKLTDPIKKRSVNVLKFDDLDALQEKVFELKENPRVIALELVDPITSQAGGYESTYHLLIEFDDQNGDFKTEAEIKKAWEIREKAHWFLSNKGLISTDDPLIPVNKLAQFLEWCKSENIPCFGHAGIAILHLYLPSKTHPKLSDLRKFVLKLGGSVSGEHGIGLTKKDWVPEHLLLRLTDLKKKYDPNNVLNRGKVL